MSLAGRAVAIIGGAVLALTVIICLLSYFIILEGFKKLDKRSAEHMAEQVQRGFADDLTTFARSQTDWSRWDDSYKFVEHPGLEFVSTNLYRNTFASLDLDMMVYMQIDGKVIYAKGFDQGKADFTPPPTGLIEAITGRLLHLFRDERSELKGILQLPDGPILFAGHPVLHSDGRGPVKGILVWGRYLNEGRAKRFAEKVRLAVSLTHRGAEEWGAGVPDMDSESALAVKLIDGNRMAAFARMDDLFGAPTVIFRVDTPRAIYREGLSAVYLFAGVVLLAALVFGEVIYLLLHYTILSRILGLKKEIGGIEVSEDLSCRLAVNGSDEITGLENSVNGMLERIERAFSLMKVTLESSATAIHVADADFNTIKHNSRFAAMWGKDEGWRNGETREEKLERMAELTNHPDRFMAKMNLLMSDTAINSFDVIKMRDGRILERFSTPFLIGSRAAGRAWSYHDVTDLKKSEEEIRDREERIRSLLESTGEAIYGMDMEGKCTFANRMFLQLFRFPDVDALIGKNIHQLIHHTKPDGSPFDEKECNAYSSMHSGRGLYSDHEHFRRSDGTSFMAEYRSSPVIRDGNIEGAVVSINDVTEKKEKEAALLQAKVEAEEATKLKDKFVSLVSHDLKNPLANIQGFLKLLAREYDTIGKSDARRMLATTLDASNYMLNIIEDLLAISRIKSGQMRPKITLVNLHSVTIRAVLAHTHFAAGKQVAIRNGVPPQATVYADEQLLLEVMMNLLSNAVKFCRKGDQIKVHCPQPGTLAVEDTGVGIAAELLPNLFNYEEKTSTRGTEGESGTGLGLPLSLDIMKAQGGKLWVESEPGKGSIFYLSLPF